MKSRVKILDDSGAQRIIATEVRSTPLDNPVIPTFDVRHSPKVRGGRISAEVFSKAHLKTIPVDRGDYELVTETDLKIAIEGGRKVAENAAKRRRSQGPPRDAQAIREEEGGTNLLEDGEQTRQRQIKRRKSKKRVQAPSQKAQMKKSGETE